MLLDICTHNPLWSNNYRWKKQSGCKCVDHSILCLTVEGLTTEVCVSGFETYTPHTESSIINWSNTRYLRCTLTNQLRIGHCRQIARIERHSRPADHDDVEIPRQIRFIKRRKETWNHIIIRLLVCLLSDQSQAYYAHASIWCEHFNQDNRFGASHS